MNYNNYKKYTDEVTTKLVGSFGGNKNPVIKLECSMCKYQTAPIVVGDTFTALHINEYGVCPKCMTKDHVYSDTIDVGDGDHEDIREISDLDRVVAGVDFSDALDSLDSLSIRGDE